MGGDPIGFHLEWIYRCSTHAKNSRSASDACLQWLGQMLRPTTGASRCYKKYSDSCMNTIPRFASESSAQTTSHCLITQSMFWAVWHRRHYPKYIPRPLYTSIHPCCTALAEPESKQWRVGLHASSPTAGVSGSTRSRARTASWSSLEMHSQQ